MSNYSINTSRRIVHVDAQGVPHEIGKVVYCDHNATPHTVWPCKAHLTNVYIVKLSTSGQGADVAYPYSVDINTMQPNITLIPGVVYSVKGDIEVYREQVLEKTIKDCYFFEQTTNTSLDQADDPFSPVSGNDAYVYGNRVATAYDTNNNPTGETYTVDYTRYTKWIANSNVDDTGRRELQLGWWDAQVGYAQNGYIFDPNYVTPLVFKRANLVQEIILSKTQSNPSNNSDILNNTINIDLNQSETFYPKLRKRVDDNTACDTWEEYSTMNLSIENFTYDSSTFTITNNNNGSWSITPLVYVTSTPAQIVITYGNINYTLNVTCAPNVNYQLMQGQYPAASIDPIIETTPFAFWIKDLNSDETYNGTNYTYHSNNNSIVSVSNDGKLMFPVGDTGQTTTVYATVEGIDTSYVTIQVGNVVTYYSIDNGNVQQVTGSSLPINISVGDPAKVIKFLWNNTGDELYAKEVYFTYQPSDNLVVTKGSTGEVTIYASGTGETVNIPIYLDSSKTKLLTTLTITRS